MQRRCCNDEVPLRKGMPYRPALFDQQPPLEHDVLGDLQYPVLKHRSDMVRQPVVQLGPFPGIRQQVDAEADFCKSDRGGLTISGQAA